MVQNQIAQNVQRSSAPTNPSPATPTQMASAGSGKAHHTVDQNGAIRYTPTGQNVAASTPAPTAQPQAAQPQQNPYQQAQQSAMQQYPELAQAGSGMNKAFLDIVNQNGGSAALQKDPSLISRYAQQAQQQQTAQNKTPVAPQPGSSRFVGPTVPAPEDDNFVGPLPGSGDEYMDKANYKRQVAAINHPSNASVKTSPQQPAPAQPATNNQSQNPLLNTPATSNSFSGNVSLGLGGASQAPKAPAPAPAPVNAAPATQPFTPNFVDSANKSMNTPKIARDISLKLDITDTAVKEIFRKTASVFGLSEITTEEALHELGREKTASTREGRFMNHLREELFKMAKDMGDHCPYSPKELSFISSSAENFQKAATLEAQSFWVGLSEDLLKRGKDESFLKGILKTAQEFSSTIGAELSPSTPASEGGLMSTLGEGASKILNSAKEHGGEAWQEMSQGASSLGETAKGVGKILGSAAEQASQTLGSTAKEIGQASSAAGSEMMDTAKETAGKLQEKAGPLIEKFKQNAKDTTTEAVSKGKNIFNNLTSSLTPEDDRHQIIPGMGNQYLGAAGGALLSALLGGQMGLSGPAAWLIPLLGGAAGYHYLPKLMNMWKDQPGTGTKSISPGAAALNQENPIIESSTPATQTGEQWKGTGFYGSPAFNRLYRNPVNNPTYPPRVPANIRNPFDTNGAGFYP
jgi:hypothetical protein